MPIIHFKDILRRFSRLFVPFLFGTGLILVPLALLIRTYHLVLSCISGLLGCYQGLPRWACHIHEVELCSLLAAHPMRLTIDRPLVHQVLLNGLSGLVGHRLLIPESLPQPLLLRLTPSYHLVKVLHKGLLHGVPSSLY